MNKIIIKASTQIQEQEIRDLFDAVQYLKSRLGISQSTELVLDTVAKTKFDKTLANCSMEDGVISIKFDIFKYQGDKKWDHLAHEFVHALQFSKGKLKDTAVQTSEGPMIEWNRELWALDTPWDQAPWEQEANTIAPGLANHLKKRYSKSSELIAGFDLQSRLQKFANKTSSSKLLALASKKAIQDFSSLAKQNNCNLSSDLINSHIKLYEGYVDALNRIHKELSEISKEDNGYSYGKYSEYKRRLSVPYNGALLHELYFEHLASKQKKDPSDKLKELVEEKWGSIEDYLEDIKSTALAAGNGWVVTFYHPTYGLENALITEHHTGHLVGFTPIMVIDTWEHAFTLDYKTNRKAYVEKFLESLDMSILDQRLVINNRH